MIHTACYNLSDLQRMLPLHRAEIKAKDDHYDFEVILHQQMENVAFWDLVADIRDFYGEDLIEIKFETIGLWFHIRLFKPKTITTVINL